MSFARRYFYGLGQQARARGYFVFPIGWRGAIRVVRYQLPMMVDLRRTSAIKLPMWALCAMLDGYDNRSPRG